MQASLRAAPKTAILQGLQRLAFAYVETYPLPQHFTTFTSAAITAGNSPRSTRWTWAFGILKVPPTRTASLGAACRSARQLCD